MKPHGIAAAVPIVEIADDAYAPRVRRPYREASAFDAVHDARMGAHLLETALIGTFGVEIDIQVAQHGPKPYGSATMISLPATSRRSR